jgi:hypothetical protein
VRSSNRSLVSLAIAVALGTLWPAAARADDSEAFFAQGRALRAEDKCGEAVVAFRRALDLKPQGLGSLRNIAECEEALGQFASARTDWWSLRRAVLQSNEPKYQGWEKDAEDAYRRLEPKVARLTVRLGGVSPERARVSIDGKPLDPRLVGVELERDLGPHVIEVTYDGAAPLVERRTLVAGSHEVVTLTIPAPLVSAEPVTKPTQNRARLRAAGIASLVVGGAGLVGLGAAIGVRQSALSSFDVCAPSYQGCPSNLRGEQSKGQTASTLVNVFTVVAIAGIGVGVPLLVVGSRKSEAPATTAITVVPSREGAALSASGRFW